MGRGNFFLHGSRHSRGVSILIDPGVKGDKIECHFNDASGRIVLFRLEIKRPKVVTLQYLCSK